MGERQQVLRWTALFFALGLSLTIPLDTNAEDHWVLLSPDRIAPLSENAPGRPTIGARHSVEIHAHQFAPMPASTSSRWADSLAGRRNTARHSIAKIRSSGAPSDVLDRLADTPVFGRVSFFMKKERSEIPGIESEEVRSRRFGLRVGFPFFSRGARWSPTAFDAAAASPPGQRQQPSTWVNTAMNPITSEELRTGESDLREMVARVLSGQLEKEKTAWRMEVAGEYSATDTAPLPASRSERQKLREAAFRSAIPNGSLFNAYDTTGGAARLSVGRILGSGANGIVCRVQDTSVSSRAVDYAGKFFVRHLAPGSSQSIQDALSELTQSVEKETAANALLLERAALGDLLEHGIAVSHGLCTLISTHPQDTKLPSPWLSSPDEVSSKGRLVIGEKVLLMPLLGPALTKFWSKAMSDEALKYLVYTLVKTVSYLHGLGLAHRDVKLSNFVVDSRGKLFLIDYGFVTKMGDTAFCGKGAPPSYMDPHRAQCILNGEDEIVVSEHWDSWSLGVTIVKLLCDGEKPFRFEFPDRKLQDLVKNKTYLREFLQKFLKALERDKFVGDSCPFLTQERKKLLSIAMLLLDPQEGTRWTVRQLEQGHPFFLT